jgi:parvulin-like peptidyl-prolyl isomerase
MRVGRLLLALGLCTPVALTGCSKRENAKLAEFKDHAITVQEFEKAYTKVDVAYLPKATGEEGLKEFLTTMLNKEVMAAKADELGYDKDPSVAQAMESFRKMSLPIAYLKREVADNLTVTDEEVRRHYDNKGASVSLKQILTDTEEEATAAYDALQGGLDFESACRQYSKTEDAASGGIVLNATYGSLVPDIQQKMFATAVGEYTEPILTAYGWVIIKVVSRTEGRHPQPFETVKDQMRTEIKQSKEAVELNKFTDKLRDDYGVVWNYDNLMLVFNALPPDRPFEEAPARDQEVYPLLYFDAIDLDKPLVNYQGKSIAIKDFSDIYDQASFYERPRRDFRLGGIRGFLTPPIMNEISADVVRKSDIEKDPEVADVLRAKKEEFMINALYEDMVNQKTVVTQEQQQAYYNDNHEMFRTPEKRQFGVILAGDMETAQKARQELRSGKPLATVANAYSIDEETVANGGVTNFVTNGENAEIDAVGFGLKRVGDISEPFQTSRGWMVLRLVELQEAKFFSYDEALPGIEGRLKNEANDKKLKELLDKWKEEFGVVIHDDNLKKVHVTERSAAEAPKPANAGG